MELTPRVRAFLAEVRFAVLATINPDGMPQQSVMWYELQGDTILLNTAVGRVKEKNLRRDPRLSLCFEDGYRFLTITGTAELVDDQATALEDIIHLARRYHGAERGETMRASFSRQQRVTVRMTVREIVGSNFEE